MKGLIFALLIVGSSVVSAAEIGDCWDTTGAVHYQIDHVYGQYLQINYWVNGQRADTKYFPLTKEIQNGYKAKGGYEITTASVTLQGVPVAACQPSKAYRSAPLMPPSQGSFY